MNKSILLYSTATHTLELSWSRRIWKQCTWNKILILKLVLDQDSLNLLGKYSGNKILKECYISALYLVLLLTHFKTKHHTCDFIICSCKKMNECASVSLYVLKCAFRNLVPFFSSYGIHEKVTTVSPSKLPVSLQNSSSFSCVSLDGLKTKTPELKQSGQPGSGAADSSSLSKSSSMFDRTWTFSNECY